MTASTNQFPALPVEPLTNEFIEFLEFFKSGNLPSNSVLVEWIARWQALPAFQATQSGIAQVTRNMLSDFQAALQCTAEMIKMKNGDELLQNCLYHISLAAKVAVADMTQDRRIYLGGTVRQRWWLGTGREQSAVAVGESLRSDIQSLYGVIRYLFTSKDFRRVLAAFNEMIVELSAAMQQPQPAAPQQLERVKHEYVEKPNIAEPLPSENVPYEFVASSPTDTDFIARLSALKTSVSEAQQRLFALESQTVRLRGGSASAAVYAGLFPEQSLADVAGLPIVVAQQRSEQPEPKPKVSISTQPTAGTFQGRHELVLGSIRKILQLLRHSPRLENSLSDVATLFTRIIRQVPPVTPGVGMSASSIFPEEVRRDANLRQVAIDFQALLGRFSSPESVESLVDILRQAALAAERDVELRNHIADWYGTLSAAAITRSFSESDDFASRVSQLLATSDSLYAKRYHKLFDSVLQNWQGFSHKLATDQDSLRFIAAWQRFLTTGLFGEPIADPAQWTYRLFGGGMQPEVMRDLRTTIFPALLQEWRYIPLPELVCEDADYTLLLRNIVLSTENVLPGSLEVHSTHDVVMRPRASVYHQPSAGVSATETANGTRIVLRSVRASLRNVFFSYRPRKGALQEGLLDLSVNSQRGLTIVVEATATPQLQPAASPSTFTVNTVHAKFHGLRLRFHETKHDLRFRLFSPLITSRLKRMLRKALEDRIRTLLEAIDRRITAFMPSPK